MGNGYCGQPNEIVFDSLIDDHLAKSRFWDGKVKNSGLRRAKSRGMQRHTDIGLPRNSTIFNIILEASAAVIPRNESDEES